LSILSDENAALCSQALSSSLAFESSAQDKVSHDKELIYKLQCEVQEKSMQLVLLQQSFEQQLKSAKEIVDQRNCQLQLIRESSERADQRPPWFSRLPSHSTRIHSALGTLKGQVLSLRQSYNDEVQALWMSVGRSMEAILTIAKAESARSRTQSAQLHHDISALNSRNSELENAMSKDAAVFEAAEAALIFERVRWEAKVSELQDGVLKADAHIAALKSNIEESTSSLNAARTQLLSQKLRMAGLLSVLCTLFSPNDHVLSTLTDGLCPNMLVLRICSRICSEHNPSFSASLLSHFDFPCADAAAVTSESETKLHHLTVPPTVTLSLQLLYNGIQEAIRSKTQSASEVEARLLASNTAVSNLEVMFSYGLK
jgi:hypothetical protein